MLIDEKKENVESKCCAGYTIWSIMVKFTPNNTNCNTPQNEQDIAGQIQVFIWLVWLWAADPRVVHDTHHPIMVNSYTKQICNHSQN